MLFHTDDMIAALVAGLLVGSVMGAVAALVLVADPLRRQRAFLRDQVIKWQMRNYAADSRLAANRMLAERTKVTPIRRTEHPVFDLADAGFSRKVPS